MQGMPLYFVKSVSKCQCTDLPVVSDFSAFAISYNVRKFRKRRKTCETGFDNENKTRRMVIVKALST